MNAEKISVCLRLSASNLSFGIFEVDEQRARDGGDVSNRLLERGLIRARWNAIAADFADELQRGVAQFFIGGRAVGLAQFANVSTHTAILSAIAEKEKPRLKQVNFQNN